MKINLIINEVKREIEIRPNDILLDILRKEGYISVKHGCESGECGVCTILLNGKAVNSCILLAAQVDGAKITTVDGIGNPDNLHPIQEELIKYGAVQCGYCTPAMVLVAKALLDKNPNPTREEIKEAIAGILCRCTGYVKIVDAIESASKRI